MHRIYFTCRGKPIKGFIEACTQEYPHFYWCFLDDAELNAETGVCLPFTLSDEGVLQPTDIYSPEHQELIDLLKDLIQQYIQGSQAHKDQPEGHPGTIGT